jgi:hypothetical protein
MQPTSSGASIDPVNTLLTVAQIDALCERLHCGPAVA